MSKRSTSQDDARAPRQRLLLPLLALLLAAAGAVLVAALFSMQDCQANCMVAERNLGVSAAIRTKFVQAKSKSAIRRGELIAEPATQSDVRAMSAYCETASPDDRSSLREIALHGTNALAVGNAVRALGRLKAVSADSELVALLADPRERVRDETILALGASGDGGVVAKLEPLTRSSDPKVRALAMHSLGRLGGERSEAAIRSVLEGASATTADRAFARAALGATRR